MPFRYADDPWRETFFRFIAENAGATLHHAVTSDGVNIVYCRDKDKGMWFHSVPAEKIAARLRVNPEFGHKVYDTIEPGTTVIITDQPVVRNRGNAAILEGLRTRARVVGQARVRGPECR